MAAFYENLAATFGIEKTMEIAEAGPAWIEKKKNDAQIAQLFMETAEPFGPHRIWSVSDCRSHCKTGMWALTATEDGCYGIGASPSDDPKSIIQATLLSGETANVSKVCYTLAMKVKKGDTFFMADKFRGRIFQGRVLEDPIGPFRTSSVPNSFKDRVCDRENKIGKPNTPRMTRDQGIQVSFPKVSWKDIGPVTPEWNEYLQACQMRPALVQLKNPPPI